MHIRHITITTNKFEESIEFYQTITELSVSRQFKAGPGEIVFLTNGAGETEIELVYMPEMQTFEGKGFFICFLTDKLEDMHKLTVEKGLNPSDIRNPDADNRYFYVYDPNGVSIQLKQIL